MLSVEKLDVFRAYREIPSDESKVYIEVLSVLWENRLPIPDGSLPLSSSKKYEKSIFGSFAKNHPNNRYSCESTIIGRINLGIRVNQQDRLVISFFFTTSLFKSDSKYSDMFAESESGGASGSGGCGDDEDFQRG
ncbi:hypothetical protein Tco_1496789 [Tanacetum coccineum]